MFGVLPHLTELDPEDHRTQIISEEFIEGISKSGVSLTKPFLGWLVKEEIGYACRIVEDGMIPVITFSDDRDAILYREKRSPLTIELKSSLWVAATFSRQLALTDELTEWLKTNNIEVRIEIIDVFHRRFNSGSRDSPKRVFLTFNNDRDFIVFKLKWL